MQEIPFRSSVRVQKTPRDGTAVGVYGASSLSAASSRRSGALSPCDGGGSEVAAPQLQAPPLFDAAAAAAALPDTPPHYR